VLTFSSLINMVGYRAVKICANAFDSCAEVKISTGAAFLNNFDAITSHGSPVSLLDDPS